MAIIKKKQADTMTTAKKPADTTRPVAKKGTARKS